MDLSFWHWVVPCIICKLPFSCLRCIYLHINQLILRYGYEFLHETYLYHVTRKDHRHNFSIYFYHLYLLYDSPQGGIAALLAFLPQLALVVLFGAAFFLPRRNIDKGIALLMSAFCQTWVFVMFNKVCTSQVRLGILIMEPNDLRTY